MRSKVMLLAASSIAVAGFVVTVPAASAEPAVTGANMVALAAPEAAAVKAKDRRDELVNEALSRLSRHVKRQSHPNALRTAFRAYFAYKLENPGKVTKPYLYYVDFGLDGRTARGYVFDMERLRLVEGPFTVAHGSGSSTSKYAVPTKFSNRPGSKQTSLGLYRAQETYTFRGKSGGRAYTSIGMRMAGVSGRFNSNARSRGIVTHGAPYVTASGAGRSEGCPAMEQSRARRLLPMIANGGMVFHFSPHDASWLRGDPWVNA